MYNDLIFDRLTGISAEDPEARLLKLIEEAEELDNLLSPEAQKLIRDLRPRTVSGDVYDDFDEGATLGERLADWIATQAGSWRFITSFLLLMGAWIGMNVVLGPRAFDAPPFILLNLALSTLAGLQAPVILMAQNRQAQKDRAVADNDYHVNLKNELEIVDLHRKMDMLLGTLEQQTKVINALASARKREVETTVRVMEQARKEDDQATNRTAI